MKRLTRIGLSFALVRFLAVSTYAGETDSPPCAAGETQSQPCALAQSVDDGGATQGQAISTASGSTGDYSLGDATVDVLLTALSLF